MSTRPLFVQGIAFFNVKFCIEPILLMLSWLKSILTEQTHATDVGRLLLILITCFCLALNCLNFGRQYLKHLVKQQAKSYGLNPSRNSPRKSTRQIIAFTTLLARRLILLK